MNYQATFTTNVFTPKKALLANADLSKLVLYYDDNAKQLKLLDDDPKNIAPTDLNKHLIAFSSNITNIDKNEQQLAYQLQSDLKVKGYKLHNVSQDTTKPNLYIVEFEIVEPVVKKSNADVYQAKRDCLARTSLSEQEIDDRVNYLKEQGIHDKMIVMVLNSITDCENSFTQAIRYQDAKDANGESKNYLRDALICALDKTPVILSAEKGTGKNTLLNTIAWLKNEPVVTLNLAGRNSIDDLFYSDSFETPELLEYSQSDLEKMRGSSSQEDVNRYQILADKAHIIALKKTESMFVKAIQSKCTLVMDEINLLPPSIAMALLQSLTDNTRYLDIPSFGRVTLNPECHIAATMNPDYEGTRSLNEALESRFAKILLEANNDITGILKENTKDMTVDPKILKELNAFYGFLQDNVRKGNLSDALLNIRGFVKAIRAYYQWADIGYTLREAVNTYVLNSAAGEDKQKCAEKVLDTIHY